jgi:hypothetical protein
LKKNEYYVYALIDPRNSQYFYIGKGKGKRYLSHLKANKWDFNITKLEKIKEIQKSGFDIKIEILFPNIDEETAFELERILIYKLGRIILSEGILTNMVPGGKWKKKESVLYSDSFQIDFDLTKLDLFAQEKFLSIDKISNFDYLDTKTNQQVIYKYSTSGDLDIIESLNCFLLDGFQGDTIELLKVIRENELPVYLRSIYSKYFFKKIYISNKLPFADFDIIDEQFSKDFDKLYDEKENFEIELKINGVQRMFAIKENDLITLHSYYSSGNRKSFRQTKNDRIQYDSFDWFENGNLKIKLTFKESHSGFSRTTYYENGNKYIEISNFDSNKTYDRWFENGNKEVELIKNIGYIYYNEIGVKIKTEPLVKKTIEPEEEMNLDFAKEELTEEMKIEKAKADLDRLEYSKIINS